MAVIGSRIKEIARAVATVTGLLSKKMKQGISITMLIVLLMLRVLAVLVEAERRDANVGICNITVSC